MTTNVKTSKLFGWSTPAMLRLSLLAGIVFAALLACAINFGVTRHMQAVKTLTQDATAGINAAEGIKSDLAEMNQLIAQALSTKPGDAERAIVVNYGLKRLELDGSVLTASEHVAFGAAQEDPIKHITHVVATYNKLATDAIDAHEKGDEAGASANYLKASALLSGYLLPDADNLDKASTYALNQSYSELRETARTTEWELIGSTALFVGVLFLVQVFYSRRFRRMVSGSMALAIVLACVYGGYSYVQFSRIDADLTSAKQDAFDSIHVLSRARASAYVLRQNELDAQLDGKSAAEHARQFNESLSKLVNLPDGMNVSTFAHQLNSGKVPDEAGGYMAAELRNVTFAGEWDSAARAVNALNSYVSAASTPASAQAFNQFITALDQTRAINQSEFDKLAADAGSATKGMTWADLALGIVLSLLIFLGINPRLKEYKAGV